MKPKLRHKVTQIRLGYIDRGSVVSSYFASSRSGLWSTILIPILITVLQSIPSVSKTAKQSITRPQRFYATVVGINYGF